MSTKLYTQILTANQPAQFPAGTIFLILTAPSALTIVPTQINAGGKERIFSGVGAGFKFKADDPADGWDFLTITATANGTITLIVGDDDVSFANLVTVAGSVLTQNQPSGTLVDQVSANALPGPGQANIVPANVNRRRVSIGNPSGSANSIYIRSAGGAHDLYELQPGISAEFDTTAAIDGRNPGAVAITPLVLEET